MKLKNSEKILFLDASSPMVQVGILHQNKWIGYFKSKEQVLQSLFQGVEVSLKMAGMELEEITSFAYCEGPGSLLGIRVVAMAIRGWIELEIFKDKEVYGYNSFELSLELIKKVYNYDGSYYVVSGARKGVWNILGSEENGNVREIEDSELKKLRGDLWYFKQRKLSSEERDLDLREFDYNLENCAESFEEKELLRKIEEPDVLFVREQEYVKWDSKRHQMEDKSDIKFK